MANLPRNIGKYRIRSSLGEGAMGVVYEGFDPDIERRVAIKTLHTHLVSDSNGAEFLERFKREAISSARCHHPNIVTLLEYGMDGGMPYIVMEFVEGQSLQDIIKQGKAINLQKSLSIISQVLKALHAAHQLDIVHRDIKTANVMILNSSGRVKLADFGIARIAERPDLTMTGAVVGTPKYMAPEQMFGLKVDSRADLFSVAMVFLDLLSMLPKSPAIPRSSLPQIPNLPPNNRIDYTILYPTALIPVLVKALAPIQAERYQTAREFVMGIKAVLPKLKVAGRTRAEALDYPTAVVQKSTQAPATNKDELDSLTNLLVDYIGPIAKSIMVAHDGANKPANVLVNEILREIPSPGERDEFLKRWEVISGTRFDSTRIRQLQNEATATQVRPIDASMLEKICEDYTAYIGPLARRLVQHHASTTHSLEHLVESLASEIPDAGEGEKFRTHWLRG